MKKTLITFLLSSIAIVTFSQTFYKASVVTPTYTSCGHPDVYACSKNYNGDIIKMTAYEVNNTASTPYVKFRIRKCDASSILSTTKFFLKTDDYPDYPTLLCASLWPNSTGLSPTSTSYTDLTYYLTYSQGERWFVGLCKDVNNSYYYTLNIKITAIEIPDVNTNPAGNISSSSMQLNGQIDGNYGTTTYYFQYGTSASYGSQTSTSTLSNQNGWTSVYKTISSLSTNITYHYRLVATNEAGTTYGNDQTFVINEPLTLNSPGSSSSPGPILTTLTPNFSWNTIPNGGDYVLQIIKVSTNSAILTVNLGPGVSNYTPSASLMDPSTAYKWVVATSVSGNMITSVYYYFQTPQVVSTPTISPPGGTFSQSQLVSISCGTSGASIRYTLNGSDPTSSSTLYTSAITITSSCILKAKAFLTGYIESTTASSSFTINVPGQCNFSDCNSPTNCGDMNYDDQVYEAVLYLCSHKIISGVNGAVLPDNLITRAAVAKIAFYGIFGDSTATPALGSLFSDNLPSPYADLQDPTRYYYRAAKCLLYLQYGDSITPFDRDRNNFLPSGTIARWQVLKVLLEAFNIAKDDSYTSQISMSQGAQGYGYVHRAFDLGITTQSDFSPNTACTRGQAFLFLRRILNLVSLGTIPAPSTSTGNFYLSSFVDLRSLVAAKMMETGNFNHYTKSSFSIPGRNVSMDFDHSYNSYLTEMPKELFPIQPLGPGWTHSYNSYIIKTIAESTEDIRWMVLWPDGSIHSYKKVGSSYICETEGIYDQFFEDDGNQFRIVTKNKITYTFNRTGTDEAAWMLTTIKDRNNNTITINYTAGPPYTNPDGEEKTTRKVNYVSDPAGRQLNFFYTNANAGLLTKVSDPLSRNIEFFYTGDNLTSFEDAKNQTTQYTYYTYSQGPPLLKKITLPEGNYITNTYKNRKLRYTKPNSTPGTLVDLDPANYSSSGSSSFLKSTVTDPEGVITKYDFNSKGKNTKVYGNASTDISTSYAISGQPWLPSTITNNKTNVSVTMAYDTQGNPTQITTSGGGNTITELYQYNSFNDVTQYTDGKGFVTIYTYNGTGNLTQVQNPLGHTITYTNNSYGQVTSITSPSNVVTNFGYNTYGNLNSTTIPALSLSSGINYDAASRMSSSTNYNGQTTSFLYDNNDNLTRETNAMSHQTNYAYDANDNLVTITNAKNIPTTMTYDTYDRLINVGFVGTNKVYTYNDDVSINTFTDPNNHTFTYTYDVNGRITGDGYATYTYDPTTSNLKTIVKDGKTITYTYDGLNRISNIAYNDFSGNSVTYTYDNNDNITSIKYPGNKTVTYSYDNANRLFQVTDWNNASTLYTYRPDDQLLTITYPNAVKGIYSYDNAGRMTGLEYKRNSGSGSTVASYSFTLDNLGNHTQEQITEPYASYPAMASQNITYTYNNANRLQTQNGSPFTYDNNGNTLSKPGYSSITYDTRNNITAINGNYTQTYEYDGLGNRRKKGNTRFVLDILGMSQVLMETDLSGNPQNYYIYGLGLISRINSSNVTSYYISDFRGSTVAMTDASTAANITHKYQYDDFGKILQITEADFNPFRYVGKYGVMYEDSLTYFMRARYYDPSIGRFLSEDPVWGVNLYEYCKQNPILNIDPNGMLSEKSAKLINTITLFITPLKDLVTDFFKENVFKSIVNNLKLSATDKKYLIGLYDVSTKYLSEKEMEDLYMLSKQNSFHSDPKKWADKIIKKLQKVSSLDKLMYPKYAK